MDRTAIDGFLANLTTTLMKDDRYLALLAGGSMRDGTMDRFSDLDLVLVYDERHRADIMAERMEFAGRIGPLLSGFTGEHVGEPRLLICLYGPAPLHVDLKFSTLLELESRIENPLILWERDSSASEAFRRSAPQPIAVHPQWIEDRFWVWVHYGATKLGRGEWFECIDFLAFLRGAVFGPLLAARHGQEARGVRKLETFLSEDELRELRGTVADCSAESCYRAFLTAIELYRKLRREGREPVTLREEAELAAVGYLHKIYSEK